MPDPILAPKTKRPAGKGRRAAAAPPSRGGGLGGLRIAGLPAPVLVGGVILAVAIGLYLRHKSSSTAASTSAAPALADTGATGGGSGGSTTGADATPYQNLADSINGLTGLLGGGGTFMIGNGGIPISGPQTLSGASTAPYQNSANPGTIYTDPLGNTVALQPSGVYQPAYVGGAGSYVSPLTYAGAGIAPDPIAVGPANSTFTVQSGPVAAPQSIPAPPHQSTSLVLPSHTATVAPAKKTTAKPVSGYSQKSKANLH